MVRLDLVRDKIRRIREVTDALRRRIPDRPEDVASDEDLRDLIAFRFYLGIQLAIDLASHVIADEGWGPAPDLRAHFQILAQRGVIDAQVARSLGAGVKIRNLVGHAYGALDPVKLHAAARALPDLLERYCAGVLALAERSGV